MATENDSKPDNWERDALTRLAFAAVNEQRRARRWRIFFTFLFFLYAISVTFLVNPHILDTWIAEDEDIIVGGDKHTALIEIEGAITADSKTNADNIITGLRNAFKDKKTVGVILRINSPGGSPVQSGYIYDEIKRLRKKYPEIPLYAVVVDLCASGGYYIASAADKIYADKASLVGSIGVVLNGFGFVNTLDKLGVERRLYTAGDHKGFLDPFSPENPVEVEHIKKTLSQVHEQFINMVKQGRGERLKYQEHPELFSGLIWTGEQGIELGLVDALGSSSYVARDIFKAEKLVNFTPHNTLVERFAERFGASAGGAVWESLQNMNLK
ncbi:S49 family peptidase [Beggiatoa leptomitoformis]|uniref:S49 family peptidase n=1 Tax=Beggiatoa leptomitoformis TaxID=288004 RepID=A0A2N9YGE8_9GAMM|nr:S49 family peptidase [Beggiatoa leptomitoformis]ALG68129.1 S49 family peptidase [Beggiatoa leptomitoformis]AUI69574.1 S49 family peptidase [Beggiatoa leptomitoformis]